MKKKIFSKFLCMISACCLIFYFGIGFRASAEPIVPDSSSVTLTPTQSLALFGSEIPCSYYNYLDNTILGRLFIKLYYKVSPKLLELFGDKEWFRKPIKRILDRKVKKLKNKGYEDTPYSDKY